MMMQAARSRSIAILSRARDAVDLKKLPGVSGAIVKKFNDLGIFHYWQLAELNHDTAHKIGEEVGLPSRADAWVARAKALTQDAD